MASRLVARTPRLRSKCMLFRAVSSSRTPSAGEGKSLSATTREENRRRKEESLRKQTRNIHMSRRDESSVLLAGIGVATGALLARQGLAEYRKYKEAQSGQTETESARSGSDSSSEGPTGRKSAAQSADAPNASSFFGSFGKRHYEGGFEEKMTRREAALILGVRESAAPQRIKDAHRRILMINHPDKGGSKYMAAKINEAKEILLKGRN